MDKSGVEYQEISSGIYCLIMPKFFVGKSFNVSLISGFEKSQGQEKGIENTIFRRNCFVSQYRNIRQCNFSVRY